MKDGFYVDLSVVRRMARQYPGIARQETGRVMDIIVRRLETEIVQRTPKGVGGAASLAGSIHGEVMTMGDEIIGIVGTPVEYGKVVEMGRRPGKFPPVEPIRLWVRSKLGIDGPESRGVAYVIARKIARKGFKGAHMFEKGLANSESWIIRMLETIPARIVARLKNGV